MHCIVYLGQANGVLVLYDVAEHATVRLPSGGLGVVTASRASSSTGAGLCGR